MAEKVAEKKDKHPYIEVVSHHKTTPHTFAEFKYFVQKYYLYILLIAIIPVMLYSLGVQLANSGSAAPSLMNLKKVQVGTQAGDGNQGRNCVGQCYDSSLDECLSSGTHKNSNGQCYNCSTPITLKKCKSSPYNDPKNCPNDSDRENCTVSDDCFLAGNTYKYDESLCSTVPSPTNTPRSNEPEISVVVAHCSGTNACIRKLNYYPYDRWYASSNYNVTCPNSQRQDCAIVLADSDPECKAAIQTTRGCTGGSPAPSNTYPSTVLPPVNTPASGGGGSTRCNPGEWAPVCGQHGNWKTCGGQERAHCKPDGTWECWTDFEGC